MNKLFQEIQLKLMSLLMLFVITVQVLEQSQIQAQPIAQHVMVLDRQESNKVFFLFSKVATLVMDEAL